MSVVTNEKPRFTLNKNTCSLCYLFKKWNLNQDWIEFSKPRNMVVVLISILISTSQNLMPIKKKKKKNATACVPLVVMSLEVDFFFTRLIYSLGVFPTVNSQDLFMIPGNMMSDFWFLNINVTIENYLNSWT